MSRYVRNLPPVVAVLAAFVLGALLVGLTEQAPLGPEPEITSLEQPSTYAPTLEDQSELALVEFAYTAAMDLLSEAVRQDPAFCTEWYADPQQFTDDFLVGFDSGPVTEDGRSITEVIDEQRIRQDVAAEMNEGCAS